MGKIIERVVNAERVEDLIAVFGSFDENIHRIEDAMSVSIVNRGTELKVTGDEEAVDMLMYNRSFSASSRFMTTIDEIIETIINKMGLAGR